MSSVGSRIAALGPLGQAPTEYEREFMDSLMDRLEQIHLLLAQPAQTGYAMSNVTPTRVLDANLASSAHTITDATVTPVAAGSIVPVAAGSIGAITGAALSTSDTYTDSAVNAKIDVVVADLRAAIDSETDVNTALMEAAIDSETDVNTALMESAVNTAVAANNTNTEVALDALGADLLTLADVVATLIDDLKRVGRLSK